jgi:hypothetical protein
LAVEEEERDDNLLEKFTHDLNVTHSQHHPLILAVPTVDALVARAVLEPQMEL